jgi:voltage-gated potassium channel
MDLRRRLVRATLLFTFVIAATVLGYRLIGGPDVGILQALYMAVITLGGVGYGEIVDTSHNPWLRIFNMFVVLGGVAITVYAFSAVTAFLVEGSIHDLFWRRRMLKKLAQLKGHYIVCGLGDTGRYAVEELQKTHTPYVVIDQAEENIKRQLDHDSELYRDMLHVTGDSTDEQILDQAGVERAAGLIAGVHSDKDNLVIIVMARQKNASLRIVARCSDLKFSERMTRAGANSTVSPNHIGGLRLASEVLRPHVVSFLDLMLKEKSRTLRIDEVEIAPASSWNDKTLEQLNLRGRYNLLPLAVKTPSPTGPPKFWVNPADTLQMQPGAVIIVMGEVKDVLRARNDSTKVSLMNAARAKL